MKRADSAGTRVAGAADDGQVRWSTVLLLDDFGSDNPLLVVNKG
jgi:hypothetical protein